MGIQIGELLAGRYRVRERLGKGGQARTFAGEDRDGTAVVIKELRFAQLEDWKAYELFQREVRVLQQLSHPAIPRCLNSFEVDNAGDTCFYLVLERVPGQSLAERLAAGWRPDEAAVRRLALAVLEVLSYLHSLAPPVIHRDLKPSNLVLDGERVYLVDFGAVQDALRPEGSSTVIGTFGYMAPEQLTGRAVPQSDLYALGGTLVHLLSGRSPAELPQRELKLDFGAYVHVTPAFRSWLETLLEPAFERRYPSADAARAALLTPQPANAPQPAAPPLRRPAGTRVEVVHKDDSLYVRIPPGNFTPQTIYLTLFSVIWLSFVAFWTLSASRAGVFFALFSLPFWLAGLAMGRTVFNSLFNDQVLELTPSGYRLGSGRFSALSKGVHGELADITAVGSGLRYRINHQPVMGLELEAGVKTHAFGTQLSRAEQLWLQSEITAYLERHLPPQLAQNLRSLPPA